MNQKNSLISLNHLLNKKSKLKESQLILISKVTEYLSREIGKKLSNEEAVSLALEMYKSNYYLYSLIKDFQFITKGTNELQQVINLFSSHKNEKLFC